MHKDITLVEKRAINEDLERLEKLGLLEDIADLLSVMQKKGHKLANETHNETYDLVNELNQYLHEAHLQLRKLRTKFSANVQNTHESHNQPKHSQLRNINSV